MGIPIPTISPERCYKEEAKQLINLSDRIFTQIRELEEELQSRGIGMIDYLADSNEYPRSTIDRTTARHIQHQVYRLRNDHKRVMEQVEAMLEQFHQSSSRTTRRWQRLAESSDDNSDGSMEPPTSETQLQPFAIVSAVLPGSPASESGLQRNDLVLQFGTVTKDNYHQQSILAAMAQAHLNEPLGIKILRNHERKVLYSTPRNGWGGLGVLGCHILPL
ncbi:hypothetical protein BCR42DRAFT_420354 [Absidia repens]|uniref:Probable 26S proteasome regulatory subunit p27 n=1 Tax=Absidia repens TaxID=90262 RepID=A0A1X2IAY6_9FUNG|nr:hypothetical protein BCR42DRAFT_420354 [Absidia repens]